MWTDAAGQLDCVLPPPAGQLQGQIAVNSSGSSAFYFGRLLTVDSISSIYIQIIYFGVSFSRLCLSRDWSVSPRLSNLWAENCSLYSSLILLLSVVSVVMCLPLFLILVICVVSLFFLSLLEAYQFY